MWMGFFISFFERLVVQRHEPNFNYTTAPPICQSANYTNFVPLFFPYFVHFDEAKSENTC
jgi:hypothetical protein